MKMDSINISLPLPMADFVRGVIERDYGNASEYFRELVRERIQKEIAGDIEFLESTGSAAPETEDDIAGVLKLQKKMRKERHARRA